MIKRKHNLKKQRSLKKQVALAIFLILLLPAWSMAQDQLPVPPAPGSWVNDYANLFSAAEVSQLDQKLNAFEQRNSTQIFVVTIDKNDGYPASMLAPMIGEEWGVGQKGKDNGVVVLVDMQDRDMYIATGYGNEEYVTDLLAGRIVDHEIIPKFKNGEYFAGIDAATDVLISLMEGQFTADEYRKQTSSRGSSIGSLIFMIIIFSLLFRSRGRSTGMGRSNLPLWIALGMMSGNRHSGSWGNFSSGSGGGFGGFSGGGGGSFGGGGAGGSW